MCYGISGFLSIFLYKDSLAISIWKFCQTTIFQWKEKVAWKSVYWAVQEVFGRVGDGIGGDKISKVGVNHILPFRRGNFETLCLRLRLKWNNWGWDYHLKEFDYFCTLFDL